jgi:hypothetical protein
MTRRLDTAPPLFVFRAVNAIRNFLFRLLRRLVPARVALFEQFTGVWLTQMIYAAAELGLADELASGPKSIDELAAGTGAHADSLARLLRALVNVGIFTRRRDGRLANNRLSETLRRDLDGSMREIVRFLGSTHSMMGWARFTDAIKSGKNGFQIAHGKPIFEYLAEHPDDEAVFQGGMVSMTELDAPSLVRGFDYSRFTKICDVGGGRGVLLAAILSTNPRLRGVLFDVPRVVEVAPAVFRAWDVADRCSSVSGSFFESVPADCDGYLLKEILHDWDDTRALQILRVCRRAMQPGAALLVMEMIVRDDDGAHPAKLLDMEMIDVTNEGRQRSEADFRRLFDQSGFRLARVVAVPGPSSIVEAVAV